MQCTKVHSAFLPLRLALFIKCLDGSWHKGATKSISPDWGESESVTEHTSPLVQLVEEGLGGIVQHGLKLAGPPPLRHHFMTL